MIVSSQLTQRCITNFAITSKFTLKSRSIQPIFHVYLDFNPDFRQDFNLDFRLDFNLDSYLKAFDM